MTVLQPWLLGLTLGRISSLVMHDEDLARVLQP